MDPTVATTLERWRARVRFPGRVVAYGLVAEADPRVPPDQALAAAVGAAMAEAPVGGRVLVALERARLREGATLAAAALAAAVRCDNLALVVHGGTRAEAYALTSFGWRIDDALADGSGPVAALAPSLDEPLLAEPVRRDAPAPVRLGSLAAWRAALADSPDAFAAADGWLDKLAAREPRVLLPHRVAPFVAAPAGVAPIAAVGELAARGRRVAWRLPRGVDLVGALPALRQLGARRVALTLVAHVDDLPPLAAWSCAPAWWVTAPLGDAEAPAALARALTSEAACLVALGASAEGAAPWPRDADHEAGTGRALASAPSAAATIVCDARGAAVALAAHAALAAAGVAVDALLATSLRPLPAAQLGEAAARGPLVVVEMRADAGLTDAVRAALPGARVQGCAATAVAAPTAGDVAQAVRGAIAAR